MTLPDAGPFTNPPGERNRVRNLHHQHLLSALDNKEERRWVDFKLGTFKNTNNDKRDSASLLKDLVALANTPGSPYQVDGQEYGYLILGIKDKTFELCGLQESDTARTLEVRREQLKNLAQRFIEPYLELEVEEFDVEGKTIHLVIVPIRGGVWHYNTHSDNTGHWVRHATSSERPRPSEYHAYMQRLVDETNSPLLSQQASLNSAITALKDRVAELQQERDPARLTATQLLRTAFTTPERTLLRAVRGQLGTFYGQLSALEAQQPNLRVDDALRQTEPPDAAYRQRLRTYIEQAEAATQPLVETTVNLITETDLTLYLQQALTELADAVTQAAHHPFQLMPGEFALRAYPALLLMHAAALATTFNPNWQALAQLMTHRTRYHNGFGSTHLVGLPWLLPLRKQFDQLMMLAGYHNDGWSATADHFQTLLPAPAWVGDALPVYNRNTTFSTSEVLLSFTHLISLIRLGTLDAPRFDARWWVFTNHEADMEGVLRGLVAKQSLFGGLPVIQQAAMMFDAQAKFPYQQRITAQQILNQMPEYQPPPAPAGRLGRRK